MDEFKLAPKPNARTTTLTADSAVLFLLRSLGGRFVRQTAWLCLCCLIPPSCFVQRLLFCFLKPLNASCFWHLFVKFFLSNETHRQVPSESLVPRWSGVTHRSGAFRRYTMWSSKRRGRRPARKAAKRIVHSNAPCREARGAIKTMCHLDPFQMIKRTNFGWVLISSRHLHIFCRKSCRHVSILW